MINFFYHQNYKFLKISGKEVVDFLNDILTAPIKKLRVKFCMHSCLLTPQGIIRNDMFVIKKNKYNFLICAEIEQIQEIKKFLLFYKLRKKIEISILDNLIYGHCLNKDIKDNELMLMKKKGFDILTDQREKNLGKVIIGDIKNLKFLNISDNKIWNSHRIKLCIPEGSNDLLLTRCYLLEAWLDKFKSVDFKKGCFIGQEVTARMHYKGKTKKKFLPMLGSKNKFKSGEYLEINQSKIGIITSIEKFDNNFDIFLVKANLEPLFYNANQEEFIISKEKKIKLIQPKWMKPHILDIKKSFFK